MTQELLPSTNTDGALALPVDVVPETMKLWLDAFQGRVETLPKVITSDEEYRAWGEVLNEATKGHTSLNNRRLDLARAYDEAKERNVNSVAAPHLGKLKALKEQASALMEARLEEVAKEQARIEAEQEAERAKARQLVEEAEKRKAVAAEQVEAATDEAGFETAAQAFDRGVKKELEANEILISVGSVPAPEAPKAKGSKQKMVVKDLKVTDLSKLALTYHMADLKKITAHIEDETLNASTPGITFRLASKVSATGR